MIGIYSFHVHAETTVGVNVKTVKIYYELYRRTHPGGTETLLVTSEESSVLTDIKSAVEVHGTLSSDTILASTDRLVIKIYANIEDDDPPRSTNPLVTLYAEGDLATRFEVKTTISAFDDRYVQVTGDTMTGTLDMGTNAISNVTQIGAAGDSNLITLTGSNVAIDGVLQITGPGFADGLLENPNEERFVIRTNNNANQIHLATDGSVGINVEPLRTLHVNGGTANVVARFESTDNFGGIALLDDGTTDDSQVLLIADDDDLVLFAGGLEGLRIDDSQNVIAGDIFANSIQADPWIGGGGNTISNATEAEILFQGVGGGNNTDITFNLDGVRPVIFSATDTFIEIAENLIVSGQLRVLGGIIEDTDVEVLKIRTNNNTNQLVLGVDGGVGIGVEAQTLFHVRGTEDFTISSLTLGNVEIFSDRGISTGSDGDFGGAIVLSGRRTPRKGAAIVAVQEGSDIDVSGLAFYTKNNPLSNANLNESMRLTNDSRVRMGAPGVPTTSAVLDLVSTTGALLVSRMTTAQRDNLTAANGMIVYNSTTNAFNFYENGSWVSGSGLA